MRRPDRALRRFRSRRRLQLDLGRPSPERRRRPDGAAAEGPAGVLPLVPRPRRGALARRHPPRRLFGEYLADLLDGCERRAAGVVTLERCADEVVALPQSPEDPARRRLELRSGRSIDADHVVLALGNSSPAAPIGLPREILESPHFLADPWAPGALRASRADQTVLLLGTGLTMVDVALDSASAAAR